MLKVEKDPYFTKVSLNRVSLWKCKVPLLVSLDMELTERCNNNCIHCYINQPADDFPAREKELRTEEIKEILKEAASLGCLVVRFTGGEPLLREDFEQLYVFARRLGLRVVLLTNATLMTSALAEMFSRIPPLEKIEITVYGMQRKSYEAVTRNNGSFEAAWRGINLLLGKKVPFIVKGALLPPNVRETELFETWASTIPWMSGPPTYCIFFNLRCRRDSEEKNRLIEGLRTSPEEGLEISTRRREEYVREAREFCTKFMAPSGCNLFSCQAGMGNGCVDAYGHLQPCMDVRHPDTVYDLKKGSLKDAMMNFFPKVREKKASNLDYLERCAKCFLKGFCEQCPGRSWMEHGTLDTPVEYFCKIAHTQAEYLGLLRKDEKAWEVNDWRERIRNFSGKERRNEERSYSGTTVCL